MVDSEGRVLQINRSAAELLGITPEEAEQKFHYEILTTAVPGEDLLESAFRGKASESETLLVSAQGAEIPVQVSVVPRDDKEGAVVVLNDLTHARRLEQELRRRERLALMGQLLAGVAHEVRNPLAGISSSAQVMLSRFEPRDERIRFVRAILDEVNRLDRLVTRLLQFARPGEPRLQKSSLTNVVRRVLATSSDWLSSSQIEVETSFGEKVPDVWFDPDLIHQVLLNLVHNAVQAMPDGGTLKIEIKLARRRFPESGRGRRDEDLRTKKKSRERATQSVVQVRIIDTGEGIDKDVIPHLFDPFFTTKASGTGLGLSICQSIIQEHGGTVQVASRKGRGTTASVELPLEKRKGERRSG